VSQLLIINHEPLLGFDLRAAQFVDPRWFDQVTTPELLKVVKAIPGFSSGVITWPMVMLWVNNPSDKDLYQAYALRWHQLGCSFCPKAEPDITCPQLSAWSPCMWHGAVRFPSVCDWQYALKPGLGSLEPLQIGFMELGRMYHGVKVLNSAEFPGYDFDQ